MLLLLLLPSTPQFLIEPHCLWPALAYVRLTVRSVGQSCRVCSGVCGQWPKVCDVKVELANVTVSPMPKVCGGGGGGEKGVGVAC